MWLNNPRLSAYIAAAQRGANVRIILDGNALNQSSCDFVNRQTITGGGSLACRKGNPTGGTYHIKEVTVCAAGQGYVNISSINGTENANKQNRETGLQVTSTAIKAIVAPGRTGNFIDAEGWIAQAKSLAQSKPQALISRNSCYATFIPRKCAMVRLDGLVLF